MQNSKPGTKKSKTNMGKEQKVVATSPEQLENEADLRRQVNHRKSQSISCKRQTVNDK